MSRTIGIAAGIAALMLATSPAALAQANPGYATPKTSWGAPDLQGVWTNSSITKLTRPPGMKKLVLTPEEAKALEASDYNNVRTAAEKAPTNQVEGAPEKGKPLPPVGNYNAVWVDPGSKIAKINGEYRSSWIVEPADGRVPMSDSGRKKMASWRINPDPSALISPIAPAPAPAKPDAKPAKGKAVKPAKSAPAAAAPKPFSGVEPPARDPALAAQNAASRSYLGPESRSTGERCLIGFGGTGGPVMLNVLYNNHYQFIQSPGHVVIDVEMDHDARIIPIVANASAAASRFGPKAVAKWLGDSVGWYEGDTLVVETRNVNKQQTGPVFISDTGKLTERFTRVGPDEILYQFIVEDPEVYSQVWKGEMPLVGTRDNVFEYACHEGNYAMEGILAGARMQERDGRSLALTADSE